MNYKASPTLGPRAALPRPRGIESSVGFDTAHEGFLGRWLLAPLRELRHRPKGQIPALDALRTAAILFVIGFHTLSPYYRYGGQVNWFASLPFVGSGWFGVDLFFVLSGYFIGRQLWRELQKTNSIHLGRFVIRRGLRIWPLYFSVFAWCALILGRFNWSTGRGWTDPVFLSNYVYQGIVDGGWSLCTEEQFYIAAPLLILLLAPLLKAVENHRVYLYALLALAPLVRMGIWYKLTGDLTRHDKALWAENFYAPFHTHCDGLIAGLIIANLDVTDGAKYRSGFFGSAYFVIAALTVCLALRWLHPEILYFTGLAILFGSTCWYFLSAPRSPQWFLNSWFFYVISRLSFGMYLNHFYLLNFTIRAAIDWIPGKRMAPALHHGLSAALVVVVSGLLATVTFCLIEYPFLRLRDRLLTRRPTVDGTELLAKPPIAS